MVMFAAAFSTLYSSIVPPTKLYYSSHFVSLALENFTYFWVCLISRKWALNPESLLHPDSTWPHGNILRTPINYVLNHPQHTIVRFSHLSNLIPSGTPSYRILDAWSPWMVQCRFWSLQISRYSSSILAFSSFSVFGWGRCVQYSISLTAGITNHELLPKIISIVNEYQEYSRERWSWL